MQELRDRLTAEFLNLATTKDIEYWAPGKPFIAPAATTASPTAAPSKAPVQPAAPAVQPAATVEPFAAAADAAATAAPTEATVEPFAAAADAAANSGSGGHGDGPSVLASCQIVCQPAENMTEVFTDLDKGPALGKQDLAETAAEIIAAADVVLPIAAMVKIFQGVRDDQANVALLLAGKPRYFILYLMLLVVVFANLSFSTTFCFTSSLCCAQWVHDIGQRALSGKKLVRTYVERVIMGPQEMFSLETLEDEHLQEPGGLLPWAVFLACGNGMDVQHFMQRLRLENCVIGKLGETLEQLPTNLVTPQSWTLPDLLTLNQPVEARLSNPVLLR